MIGKGSVLPIIVAARDHCYEARLFTAQGTYSVRVTRSKVYLSFHGMTVYGTDLDDSWTDDTLVLVLWREGNVVTNATIHLATVTKVQLVDPVAGGYNVLREEVE